MFMHDDGGLGESFMMGDWGLKMLLQRYEEVKMLLQSLRKDRMPVRGDFMSVGRRISPADVPKQKKTLAPRSYVDFYHMATRMSKAPFMTDFQHIEFAWWWKACAASETDCLENVNYLLDMIVGHLKSGKGQKSQEILALATNTIALLYLFGLMDRPYRGVVGSAALGHYNKMLLLLNTFDETEAKDRTLIEMCAHDLVVKIKKESTGTRRALYNGNTYLPSPYHFSIFANNEIIINEYSPSQMYKSTRRSVPQKHWWQNSAASGAPMARGQASRFRRAIGLICPINMGLAFSGRDS
jgi:hypothetical protein